MTKTLFIFCIQVCEHPGNTKSNYYAITTIQKGNDGQKYLILQNLSAINIHPELKESKEFTIAMQAIKIRGQFRNVRIMLHEEMRKIYEDEAGNMIFKDYMLEEYYTPVNELFVQQIVRKHTEAEKKEKPLALLVKDVVLEKFENKNQNAKLWVEMFETNCKHVNIEEESFPEAIYFFIAGSVLTW